MVFNKMYEEQLLQVGYESLPYEYKNMLVSDLANNFGITFNEVTMDMILDVHKSLKLAETKELYDMEIDSGFIHPETGRMYDITLNKQVDMIGIRVLLQTTEQTTVDWVTEDSGIVTHTEEEFIELFESVISYKKVLDTKLMRFNEAIMLAKVTNDILVLDWYDFNPEDHRKGDKDNAENGSTGPILPEGVGSESTGPNEGESDGSGSDNAIDGGEPKSDSVV